MSDFLIIDDNKRTKESSTNIKGEGLMTRINNFLYSLQKVRADKKSVFYRLLSTMTNSGMSIVRAISILEHQENDKMFKQILRHIHEDLVEGKNLSDSMGFFPYTFSEAEIGMVRSGEKTGKLNQTFLDLSDQIEKIASIGKKLKSAMMYPAFILVVVFGVVFVLMTMVVPKLLDIFGDQSSLPTSTQTLIAVSDFFSNYWYLMIAAIIGFIVFVIIWKRTADGKYRFDSMILSAPVFGKISRKLILSKFARVFSGLVSSGVSIVEALRITADAVGNEKYKQRILLLAEDVSGGIKIHESLDGDKLFDDMIIQMIQVGEETSKIDETVAKVADFYDEEVDNTIAMLNKLLEPFIIVTLAVIVGLIALGIIEPIMGIADSVSQA